jgi:hypothetical protein
MPIYKFTTRQLAGLVFAPGARFALPFSMTFPLLGVGFQPRRDMTAGLRELRPAVISCLGHPLQGASQRPSASDSIEFCLSRRFQKKANGAMVPGKVFVLWHRSELSFWYPIGSTQYRNI